jgi:hypothetical protein
LGIDIVILSPNPAMKVVFELSRELAEKPEYVAQVQAMTLNAEKPLLGLRGTYGLFGSNDWWSNIANGKLRTITRSGVIQELIFAGQDARWGDEVNSFRLVCDDDTIHLMSIRVHEKTDRKLFCVGASVWAVYVLDELKNSPRFPFQAKNFSESLLEMAVSRRPVTAQPKAQADSPAAGGPAA